MGGQSSPRKHTEFRLFFKRLPRSRIRMSHTPLSGTRSAPRADATERPVPDIEVLPHLLPPVPHDRLVLADAQLLAVHEAGALGPRLVFVVGVLLQVLLAETGLLLVIWLFL